MKTYKSTNKEFIDEILALNTSGQYDELIEKAKENYYHDYKSSEALPKSELVNDLSFFPELSEIRQAIMNGDYDESPDEEDKEDMRRDVPQSMWKALGLD